MKKEMIRPVAEIFHANGEVNKSKVPEGFAHALGQIEAGHFKIENGTATEKPIGPGRVAISINFERQETDQSVKVA